MIKVAIKRVGSNSIDIVEIPKGLQAMQDIVEGYIECVRLPKKIDLWVNEEGLLLELPLNLTVLYRGEISNYIVGDVFFASHDEYGDTISLNDDQIKWISDNSFDVGITPDGRVVYGVEVGA